ncbi:MAG: Gfo/Idh/MocA family oxidoreductase [Isosphaeraceae bacterium]
MDAVVKGNGLNWLVVGTGFLGSMRAAALGAARGSTLVAVTDLDESSAQSVAARCGVVPLASLEEGLQRRNVNAVVIATPHADHAGQVRQALDAGKHVLCEKPLTIDADEARALAVLAESRGLRLATGLNHRFYPPVRDALELVKTRAIGRVERVRATIGHEASSEFLASWHTDPARSGGGTLMDNGPHACDLIRRLMGEIISARGEVSDTLGLPEGCESEAVALFLDADGTRGELQSSWLQAEGYLSIEIRGDAGRLHLETAPWRLSGKLSDGRRIKRRYGLDRVAERFFRLRHGCERSLVWELEAFAGLAMDRGVCATAWDGYRATEMVQAVYGSSATGREVALSPMPVRGPTRARRSRTALEPRR